MVRRSTTNEALDINGVGAAFQSEAEAFTGAGDGFIRWWYDRSGNNFKLGQGATYELQPQIITAGVTNKVGGKTSITFLDQTLAAVFTLAQPYTLFFVVRANAYDAGEVAGLNNYVDGATTPAACVVRRDNATTGFVYGGATLASDYPSANNELFLVTLIANGASSKVYKNGVVHASGNLGELAPGGLVFGGQVDNTRFANMDLMTTLLFNSAVADGDIDYINDSLTALHL